MRDSLLPSFLISGPRFFGVYHAAEALLYIIEAGGGPYYGISWNERELFVLDRNQGKGDVIHVYDSGFHKVRSWELGRSLDGHQILYHKGFIYITATCENSLVGVCEKTGEAVSINWTPHTRDVNHINGLGLAGPASLWVSQDNRKGTPSEVVRLCLESQKILEKHTLESPLHGTHNVERDLVLASGEHSCVWAFTDGAGFEKIWTCENAFFRGLGYDSSPGQDVRVLIGASGIMTREERRAAHAVRVYLCRRQPFQPLGYLEIPQAGQIYDLRTLKPGDSHNGIAFPGRLDSLRAGSRPRLPMPGLTRVRQGVSPSGIRA